MSKVNIAQEKLQELMDSESWIKPEDAVAMGFASGIVEEDSGQTASQSAREAVMKALDGDAAAPTPGANKPPAEPPQQKNKILKLFERSN